MSASPAPHPLLTVRDVLRVEADEDVGAVVVVDVRADVDGGADGAKGAWEGTHGRETHSQNVRIELLFICQKRKLEFKCGNVMVTDA